MTKILIPLTVLILATSGIQLASAQLATVDDLWAEVSRTVSAGDFDGYAATYHPDAVLVNKSGRATYPITTALAGWKQGFDDTMSGKQESGVEFRFSQRLSDETTAHDTGIFHYWFTPDGGERTDVYVEFEGLLVKKDGWLMMMEYQKDQVSKEEWDALM